MFLKSVRGFSYLTQKGYLFKGFFGTGTFVHGVLSGG